MGAKAKKMVLDVLLKQNGISKHRFAREAKITSGYVAQVMTSIRPGADIRAKIAKAVGQDYNVLWPAA